MQPTSANWTATLQQFSPWVSGWDIRCQTKCFPDKCPDIFVQTWDKINHPGTPTGWRTRWSRESFIATLDPPSLPSSSPSYFSLEGQLSNDGTNILIWETNVSVENEDTSENIFCFSFRGALFVIFCVFATIIEVRRIWWCLWIWWGVERGIHDDEDDDDKDYLSRWPASCISGAWQLTSLLATLW